jgi:NhaP-type Na+/H+ or K+/H+ antiporter
MEGKPVYVTLATLAGCALAFCIVAKRLEKTVITGPILFVLFGFLAGSDVFGLLPSETSYHTLCVLAELTLAMVLFADAAGTNLGVLREYKGLPIRMLAIGLPLTILLGYGLGVAIFPELALLEVALLATMLAPTDAALGQAVVQNKAVPNPIRQGLNVESGLNDGICVPILFLFLALAEGAHGDSSPFSIGMKLLVEAIGIGLVVCGVLVFVAAQLLKFAHQRGWLSPAWNILVVAALSFTCFGVAQALGGSGFIACFVGGLLFGALLKPHHEELLHSAEGIGGGFSLITWVLFGAVILGRVVEGITGPILLYSLLSLTVIRMLPIFLSLLGTPVSTPGKLFLGWFGPRGLASVVFAVIVMEKHLPGGDLLKKTVGCTILLSVFLHGVTANPLAKRLGERFQRVHGSDPELEA